jgi:predicted transcriptional regulator
MSNNEMNAYLKHGAPPGVKLSGSECAIYLIICHRYDTRADVMSAYPGMEEFRRATTLSRSAIECALTRLKTKGLITQVQKGYIGKRAEYVPTYSISLLHNSESVAYVNTLDNEVSRTRAESVSNTGIECPADEQRVSSTPVTISTVSNVNNNKYDSLRFNSVILLAIPERLRTISPGSNFEKLLDECDSLGITDEIRRLLSTNRWDNVQANAGGLVSKIIKDALERKRSGHLVASPAQVTPSPAPYIEEIRELEPIKDSTRELIEKTKRKLKGFGSIPE